MNLIEGLQKEANRRRELLPQYEAIGAPGFFGMSMLKLDIDRAERTIASGDVVEMVAVYKELSEAKID
jgi:hypothetical protein